MIQEIFNTIKDLIFHNESSENQEVHDVFDKIFGENGKMQIEMIAVSPDLNGQDKDNSEDYYEGLGYSLPVVMYMMRRSINESDALEEQKDIDISESLIPLDSTGGSNYDDNKSPYHAHLDDNYEILAREIKQAHIKFDDTLKTEDIRIPSQNFIESLTSNHIQKIIETENDLVNAKENNNDTISQEL